MKHIFDYRDKIREIISAKFIFLFLDYDGTLAPIVDIPDEAIMPVDVRVLLEEFSKRSDCKLAIVSGRPLEGIKNIVGLKNIIYAGNHGLEIEGPRIKFKYQIPGRTKSILRKIYEELNKKLSKIKGVFIEDKGVDIALHYRMADKKDLPLIKSVFHDATIIPLVQDKIKITTGKMLLEARPAVRWDKGKVVLWLLARQQFAMKNVSVLPIYIGDDITDEDAFEALKGNWLTIFVGKPRDSHADYFLKNTEEAGRFLREILELKKSVDIL